MTLLDDLFARDSAPAPGRDLFTDRVPELDAFRSALDAHLARLLAEPDAAHNHPRDNVVAFHGIGGRGKSTLSQRLERWVQGELGPDDHWGQLEIGRPVVTTRIDLAQTETFDVERAVLQLRASAGSVDTRLYAFDIALALWWRQYHGSRELTRLPVSRGSQGIAAEVRGHIADQLMDTSVAVLEELGAAFGLADFGIRVARRLGGAARHRQAERAAAENRFFAPVLKRLSERVDLDELSYLPLLLGEDIRRLPPEERPLWVVFVDTYELVNDDRRRSGEREFQRMVIELPDVLWVVTGRKRLDWADPARGGAVDWAGPGRWPGLDAAAAPSKRQFAIGDLDPADAASYIERATAHLELVAPADVVDVIVQRSGGIPLLLERYVGLLIDRVAAAVELDAECFDVAFDALIEQIVRDLEPEEHRALLTACVFPRFSPGLVAATGDVTEAAVIRLHSKGLAEPYEWPLFGYKIHNALRQQIRLLTPAAGGWTERDWARHASRGLDALADTQTTARNADRQRDCFTVGMSVALDFGLEAAWLVKAAGGLPTLELAAQAVPPVSEQSETSWAGYLAAVLRCWLEDGSGRERHKRLAEVAALPGIPPEVYGMAQRFRAYSRRNHGDPAGGLAIFDQLTSEGIGDPDLNLRQRCFMLHSLGRFTEAAVEYPRLRSLGCTPAELAVVEASRATYHGLLREAADGYRLRREDTLRAGRLRLARDNLADCLAVEALLSPPDVDRADEVRRSIAADGLGTTYRTACFGVAVMAGGQPDAFERASAELTASFQLPHEPGESGHTNVWRSVFPHAFDAAVRNDAARLAGAVREIQHVVYQAIANGWLSRVAPDAALPLDPIQWGEDSAVVEKRWWQVVLDRRAAVGLG